MSRLNDRYKNDIFELLLLANIVLLLELAGEVLSGDLTLKAKLALVNNMAHCFAKRNSCTEVFAID